MTEPSYILSVLTLVLACITPRLTAGPFVVRIGHKSLAAVGAARTTGLSQQ